MAAVAAVKKAIAQRQQQRKRSFLGSRWFWITSVVALSLVVLLRYTSWLSPKSSTLAASDPAAFERRFSPVNDEEREFFELERWLAEGGATIVPSLRLADPSMDTVRGVYTTERMDHGSSVMSIPPGRLITTDLCGNYPVGRAYLDRVRGDPDWIVQLAIVLLEEEKLKEKSRWWPYLRMLPKSLDYFPMFFPAEVHERELKGSQVLQTIAFRRQTYRNYYEQVRGAFPTWPVSFDEFVRGILLVNSRNFGIDLHGKETNALVPLADLLNHEMPPAPTTWQFDNRRDAFTVTVTASRGIGRGAAVHDSYGHRCNNRLFAGYGFTLEDNPANTAIVAGGMDIIGQLDAPSTTRFLSAMRSRAANQAKSAASREERLKAEIAGMEAAIKALDESLAAFPQTLQEDLDQNWPKRAQLPFNLRNCLVMRVGEKRVLHWLCDILREGLQVARDPNTTAASIRSRLNRANDATHFDYFLQRTILPLFN